MGEAESPDNCEECGAPLGDHEQYAICIDCWNDGEHYHEVDDDDD